MTATPALQLTGLVKAFGETTAVDHLDLTVPAGSVGAEVAARAAARESDSTPITRSNERASCSVNRPTPA